MADPLLLLCCLLGLFGQSLAQEPDCFCLERLVAAEGLRSPTLFAVPPDGTNRKFIAEQPGVVWILDSDNQMLEEPFLNLSSTVLTGGEQGFLALTFHPDFSSNRRLYIYYSVQIGQDGYTRLSEILVDASNPNVVDYASERMLLEFFQPFTNHNGGDMLFADDRYLYISIGDGGFAGDPMNNALNLTTLLGKILRIDVDSRTGDLEYGIPPDNPDFGVEGALPEIYAYGLRNPWRMSMDIGDSPDDVERGRIFIGDVGQDEYEEVDLLEFGGNFGWKAKEGFECYDPVLCAEIEGDVLPVIAYSHEIGQSVTGGYVYRGASTTFNGWYFFADYMTHKIFRMIEIENSPGQFEYKEVFPCSTACVGENITTEFGRDVQAFGQDESGEVYFVTQDRYVAEWPLGNAYRIVDPLLLG